MRELASVKRRDARAMRQGTDKFPRGNPGEAKSEPVSFTGLEHRPPALAYGPNVLVKSKITAKSALKGIPYE